MHSGKSQVQRRPMATYFDIEDQLEGIDLNIISLLADRAKLVGTLDEPVTAETIEDTVAMWVEEAGEKGLDEAVLEKICKLVLLSSKKAEE